MVVAESVGGDVGLNLRWKSAAIGSGIVAVCAIAALAVVASLDHAGSLATIALALAILAFVIQIMVFIAQNWTTGQQLLRSEQINASTQSLLIQVNENARGTNNLLAQQFDKVLERALAVTSREVRKRLPHDEAMEITDTVAKAVEHDLRTYVDGYLAPDWHRPPSEDDSDLERYLTTYPTEAEVKEDLNIVDDMSKACVALLTEFGRDEIACLYGKGRPGKFEEALPDQGQQFNELLRLGLIEESESARKREESIPRTTSYSDGKGQEIGEVVHRAGAGTTVLDVGSQSAVWENW